MTSSTTDGNQDGAPSGGGNRDEHRLGFPFDNASVAGRLQELPATAAAEALTVTTSQGEFSAFRATPAQPDPSLGDAVLVHGWPEYASCWEETAAGLLAQGMSVFAYDQRGYSPGARPDGVEDYAVSQLVGDLAEVTRAAGIERFHLVGHDWGGVVAWPFVANHPQRLHTCTVVSTPHPKALGRQLKTDDEQYARMEYMRSIQDHPEAVANSLLRNDGERLIGLYGGAVPGDLAASYVERFSEPGTFVSVLKYYQAMALDERMPSTPITVPTSFIWGSEDVAFTRTTAELSAHWVEGPYRFVPLEGASHWLPESHPDDIVAVVVEGAREYADEGDQER
ncbi:alpha/beta fold hydrolase [Brevibacterium oceani]|uniref:alpha/beta fold hydrolase n=1 Tax=Brevibacterium oceani TaxID=358099 RepID=UPI001B3347F2|nr:alpha/beta hydrolase [Brevibacterium oceani]